MVFIAFGTGKFFIYSTLIHVVGKMTLKMLRFWKSRTSVLTSGPIGKYYKGGFEQNMSKREAYLILGLSARATEEEVKVAHKKLMLLNHPDSGKNFKTY